MLFKKYTLIQSNDNFRLIGEASGVYKRHELPFPQTLIDSLEPTGECIYTFEYDDNEIRNLTIAKNN